MEILLVKKNAAIELPQKSRQEKKASLPERK
jgi:hypothetical protein